MYYRLLDSFVLRGWEKMNTALVERPQNKVTALAPREFNILMLCDGETDLAALELSAEETAALDRFAEKGIIASCDVPSPVRSDQQYKYYPNRFVDSCFWSVTGRCNYRCRHCYLDAPEGTLGELSHEEALLLMDQMADCGVLKVDLTGGEPFVRKDFWQLIDELLRRQITVGMVYSNGWLLTDEVLDAFEQRGIKPGFSISFDGLGQHDWMRGVKGAEEAALQALERCIRRGFYVNVEMCIHRGNAGVLRETINRLAEMGIRDVKCSNVSFTSLWLQNSEGNALSQQEYTDLMLEYIPQFFEDGMPAYLTLCNVIVLNKDSTEYSVVAEKRDGTEQCLDCYLCGAARASCYISPEGRMLPCMPMTACEQQAEFPTFMEVGLRKGLSDGRYMKIVDSRVRDLLAANSKCNACEHKLVCGGGCRAVALEQTGELMGADPSQCFLWENGYVEKIHKAVQDGIARYKNRQECKQHED